MSSLNVDIVDVVTNRPLFNVCATAVIALYGLNFVLSDCTERVGLVTANTLITNTYVWNLITSCFYEQHILKVVLDLIALLYATKSLPVPNIEQFGLYFLFSILGCTIGTSTYCFFSFMAVPKESSLITPIYGFGGVLMCILMYARHQYKHDSVIPAMPKLTFHHLPIVFLVTQVALYFLWCKFLVKDIHFTIVSLFFSWSYLRFFYKHDSSNTDSMGDNSDDFTFVGMFPEVFNWLETINELVINCFSNCFVSFSFFLFLYIF